MSDLGHIEGAADPVRLELQRCQPRLRTHLARRARGLGSAELDDLAQEVAARALRYAGSFERGKALWPWLRQLADRVVWDQLRRREREPQPRDAGTEDPTEVPAPLPPPALDEREEVEHILSALTSVERRALEHFHLRGESIAEVARALDLPEGTVKSHLSRARRRLAGLGPASEGTSEGAGR